MQQFQLLSNPNQLTPHPAIFYGTLNTASLFNYNFTQNKNISLSIQNNSMFMEMLARTNQSLHGNSNATPNTASNISSSYTQYTHMSGSNNYKRKFEQVENSVMENLKKVANGLTTTYQREIIQVEPLVQKPKDTNKRSISDLSDQTYEEIQYVKRPRLKFGMDTILGTSPVSGSSSRSVSPSKKDEDQAKTPSKNSVAKGVKLNVQTELIDSSPLKTDYAHTTTNLTKNNSSIDNAMIKNNVKATYTNKDVPSYQIQAGYNPNNDQDLMGQGFLNSIEAARFYQANPYLNPVLWPLKSKQRRGVLRRAVFSDQQRKGLETAFLKQKYINKPDRKKLASKLSLKDSQVKIWFQNRRMKWRNTKERELMKRQSTNKKSNKTDENLETNVDNVDDGFNSFRATEFELKMKTHFNEKKNSANCQLALKQQQVQQVTTSYLATNEANISLPLSINLPDHKQFNTDNNSPNAFSYVSPSVSTSSSRSVFSSSILSYNSSVGGSQTQTTKKNLNYEIDIGQA